MIFHFSCPSWPRLLPILFSIWQLSSRLLLSLQPPVFSAPLQASSFTLLIIFIFGPRSCHGRFWCWLWGRRNRLGNQVDWNYRSKEYLMGLWMHRHLQHRRNYHHELSARDRPFWTAHQRAYWQLRALNIWRRGTFRAGRYRVLLHLSFCKNSQLILDGPDCPSWQSSEQLPSRMVGTFFQHLSPQP